MATPPCLLAFLHLYISSLSILHSSILDKKVAKSPNLKPSFLAFDPIPSWYSRNFPFARIPALLCISPLPASFCLTYVFKKKKNWSLNFVQLISENLIISLNWWFTTLTSFRSLESGFYRKYTPDNVLSSITSTSFFPWSCYYIRNSHCQGLLWSSSS